MLDIKSLLDYSSSKEGYIQKQLTLSYIPAPDTKNPESKNVSYAAKVIPHQLPHSLTSSTARRAQRTIFEDGPGVGGEFALCLRMGARAS